MNTIVQLVLKHSYSMRFAAVFVVFSHHRDRTAACVARAGTLPAGLALAGLPIYAARKLDRRHRFTREFRPMRITPADPMGGENSDANPSRIIEGLCHGD